MNWRLRCLEFLKARRTTSACLTCFSLPIGNGFSHLSEAKRPATGFRIASSATPRDWFANSMLSRSQTGPSTAVLAIRETLAQNRRPEQLRQSQKMEAMGMLAGGIAHDFNNLLTIIAGYSQMLQTSSQMKTERDRTAVEQVLKACERAAGLTAQLLSFSRRQISQPEGCRHQQYSRSDRRHAAPPHR